MIEEDRDEEKEKRKRVVKKGRASCQSKYISGKL